MGQTEFQPAFHGQAHPAMAQTDARIGEAAQFFIVAMGMSIPQLISGTIVVENVFSWPGLGTLCISSIFNRDYPVIQTYVLLIGVLFVLFNLLFDILQTVSDPRLRKED